MTEVKPLKVGEKLEPKPGEADADYYTELELLGTTTTSTSELWWVKLTVKGGGEPLVTTFDIVRLRDQWVRTPSFFRVGRTYRQAAGFNRDEYTIIEVFALDNPIDSDWASFAVARVKATNGKEFGGTLNAFDFTYMEEVR